MAKRRRPGRFITQAQQDAIVRFGPEISGLKALIAQAQADKASGVSSAKSTASSITSAINQATPAVAHIYQQAGATTAAASNRVQADVAGLQGLNPNIVAAIAAERANASTGVTSSRASTLSGLQTQKVAAQRGRQFAIQRARSDFASAVGKVLQRNLDLGQERGAFVISEAGKARDAAAQRRQQMREVSMRLTQQERASLRASGTDPVTGGLTADAQNAANAVKVRQQAAVVKQQQAKQKAAKVNGPKSQAPGQMATAQSTIGEIAQRVKGFQNSGLSRQEIVAKLVKGRPRQTIKVNPDNGQKLANPVVLGEIPSYKPNLLMTAALDVQLDGHLSRQTEARLRKLGYNIGALGYPTYKQWRRQKIKESGQLGKISPGVIQVGVGVH